MSLSGFMPVLSRRAIVMASAVALASAVSGSALRAQGTATPPQTPAAAPQTPAPPPDPLKFTTAGPRVVFLSFTADAAQAMEQALAKTKDALSKASSPEQKQQIGHWKIFKGAAQTDGSIPFLFVLDQTVPNVSYNPFVILQNAGLPAEEYAKTITPLFTTVNSGFKALSVIESTMIDIGAPAGGGGAH
jgi:hypothetical protein